jgi:hypothetical protein
VVLAVVVLNQLAVLRVQVALLALLVVFILAAQRQVRVLLMVRVVVEVDIMEVGQVPVIQVELAVQPQEDRVRA